MVTKLVQRGMQAHETPAEKRKILCMTSALMFGNSAITLDRSRPIIVLIPEKQ